MSIVERDFHSFGDENDIASMNDNFNRSEYQSVYNSSFNEKTRTKVYKLKKSIEFSNVYD